MIQDRHRPFWPYLKSPDRFLRFFAQCLHQIDGNFYIFQPLKKVGSNLAIHPDGHKIICVFAFFLGLALIPITFIEFLNIHYASF